jgi:ferric-dicitrate binding protein FerR (iron transport regulator)
MRTDDFNRLVDSVREDRVDDAIVAAASQRVRAQLEMPAAHANVEHLRSCADFQALIPEYRERSLSEARRMLVEDHLHSCVACRKAFRGDTTQKVIEMKPRIYRRAGPWALAAAAAVIAAVLLPSTLDKVFAPSGERATIASIDGALYRVSGGGAAKLTTGMGILEGEEIRTAKGSHAMLVLRDGSRVEMNERSELSVSQRWSGATIRLARGNVIVQAAKQRRGSLEVSTPDYMVSVKGTIFAVSAGVKGSRVSVVEGQVKVEQERSSHLLARGEQVSSNPSLSEVPVRQDIAWSRDAGRYLELLGEFAGIQKRLEAMPGPSLRYTPSLAKYLPADTVFYAAIPNLSATIGEAERLFEERVRESQVLREWWDEKNAQKLRLVLNQVKTAGEYLGDEVVIAASLEGKNLSEPFILAEAKKPGLRNHLQQQFAAMQVAGDRGPRIVDAPPLTVNQRHDPLVMIRNNIVVLGDPGPLARISPAIDGQAQGGLMGTPFYARIQQAYQSGAGWVFAADLEQIVAISVPEKQKQFTGMGNVKYLMVERKENGGRTENKAVIAFADQRKGIAAWLAAPAPMGTLEFTSPDATFASSFVIKNPRTIIDEVIQFATSMTPRASEELAEFERRSGLSVTNDIAGSLGGEITVSLDGPLLPTPSWKIAAEVYDSSRLQFAIERLVEVTGPDGQRLGELGKEVINNRTYYKLAVKDAPFEIHYTYADGYLLAAPNRAMLDKAIQGRSTAFTLSRSPGFRAQLPTDGYANFSALLYYNMAPAVGPLADQLKSTGILNPQQQKAIEQFTANREPTLIYAYGEADRITVASRGSFFGFNLDTLVSMSGRGRMGIPGLLVPVMPVPRDAAVKQKF